MNVNNMVFDLNEAQRQQYKMQMAENYRQSAALQLMVSIVISYTKEEKELVPKAMAKEAKALADALVEEIFPEEN
jgi:hypothetical protein